MDTENAATIASTRNCRANAPPETPVSGVDGGPTTDLADRMAEVEAARRHLTLAALRWQARIDARNGKVS